MLKEFINFLKRGNVIDLAVAVILGGAFGAIVNSIVKDLLMPLIGILIGGVDFTGLKLTVGSAEVLYGNFIQQVVNFVIIALVLFFVIRGYNAVKTQFQQEEKKKETEAEAKAKEEVPTPEVKLLTEIRDLLRSQEQMGK